MHGKFVLPHLLIYSLNYISLDSQIFLFYSIIYVINKYGFISSFALIILALAIGSSFSCLCVPLAYSYHCGSLLIFLKQVLHFWYSVLQYFLCFSCPCPRISPFSEKPWFLQLQMTLEIKILMLGGFITLGPSLLLYFSVNRTEKYMYTYLCTDTTNKFLYVNLCNHIKLTMCSH